MGVKAGEILYYIIHFQELRAIIQWYVERPKTDGYLITLLQENMA